MPASHHVKVGGGDVVTVFSGSGLGDGATVQVAAKDRVFQVVIDGTATVKTQVSLNGTNWIDARTSTASEGFSMSEPWAFVRGVCSAYTSGSFTLLMGS